MKLKLAETIVSAALAETEYSAGQLAEYSAEYSAETSFGRSLV